MNFVIINDATSATDANGGPIDDATLDRIARALQIQMNRDFSDWWGGDYRVRVGKPDNVQPGEVVCAIVDALPDAPGAIAYHDVDNNETPVVFIAKSQCSSLTKGFGSLSQGLSHELTETGADRYGIFWSDTRTGQQVAIEVADPTEGDSYSVDVDNEQIDVSNFVLPAWFAPNAPAPWTFLGSLDDGRETVQGPLQLAAGGYVIERSAPADAAYVTGTVSQHRMARKQHWSSRTYKRGVRL